MKEFKGTTGPWKYDKGFNQIQSIKGSTLVMSFGKSAKIEDKILIAAAPELLGACTELLIMALEYDLHGPVTELAQTAINKALGES